MASIKSYLDNIKNAVFGKDVRGSIHDGIDEINKEVESTTNRQVNLDATFKQLIINSGESNAEIVAARHDNSNGQTYDTLPERLDATTAQLATKAEQTYVDIVLSTIAQGGPKELFYSKNAMWAKYPNGAKITVLVFDVSFTDGAHSFIWDGSEWKDLGVYQANGVAPGSVGEKETTLKVPFAQIENGVNSLLGISLIKDEDVKTSINGSYTLTNGQLIGKVNNYDQLNSQGALFFQSYVKSLTFEYLDCEYLILAGDEKGWNAVGLSENKGMFFDRLVGNGINEGFIERIPKSSSIVSAMPGDTIKVDNVNGKFTFKIKQVGKSEFTDWFIIDKTATQSNNWEKSINYGIELYPKHDVTIRKVYGNTVITPELKKEIATLDEKVEKNIYAQGRATTNDFDVVNSGVLIDENNQITADISTGFGEILFKDRTKEISFEYVNTPYFILGGDLINYTAIGLAVNPGLLFERENHSGSFTNRGYLTFTGAAKGDVIKVKIENGIYVFRIRRVNGSDFTDWFTIEKANYPETKYWVKESFGFEIVKGQNMVKDVVCNTAINNVVNYQRSVIEKLTDSFNGTVSRTEGEVMNVLGDSITAAQFIGVDNVYWNVVKKLLKLSKVNNYGISGSTVANNDMVNRAGSMDTTANIVIVFGGTNDFGNPPYTELGTMSDENVNTFYAAYKSMLRKIIANNPTAVVITLTPLQRNVSNQDMQYKNGLWVNDKGYSLLDYVDAVKEVSEFYSVPCIDLYRTFGVSDANGSAYLLDGLHLNVEGHKKLGTVVTNFLQLLI